MLRVQDSNAEASAESSLVSCIQINPGRQDGLCHMGLRKAYDNQLMKYMVQVPGPGVCPSY